jgi:two-component system LytT family response regulator
MDISIDYRLMRKPSVVTLSTAILVLLYNSMSYFHPTNNQWLADGTFNLINLIRFVLIDQFLIELITVGLLFSLIRKFGEYFNKTSVTAEFAYILKYMACFLPVILLSFIAFNPITQTIRFLVNNLPDISSDVYLKSYFYSWKLFFTYLPATLLAGYGVLLVNLFLNYKKQLNQSVVQETFLLVTDAWGSKPLPYHEIDYIEKDGRYYFVYAGNGKFKTSQNFAALEKKLPVDFVRINRSVIVNLKQVKNYAYWEYDKYLLRLLNGKEFIMPRQRLKKLKSQLKL